MLTAIKKRMGRDEDEGFTLIELMVVVLIIAILLAIAIPTFLGARNTANARSTQSNLRNALTAEQTNWTNTQAFTGDASSIEPSLDWSLTDPTKLVKGAKSVAAITSGSDAVTLVGFGKDNNCYAIYQSNSATQASDFTAYAEWKPTTATGCDSPTAPTDKPTAAGSGNTSVTPAAAAGWYTAW